MTRKLLDCGPMVSQQNIQVFMGCLKTKFPCVLLLMDLI